jgi:hypothetical protein
MEHITEIKFDTQPVEDKYRIIKDFIHSTTHCIVEFKKKDGTLRTMPCTLDTNFMPHHAVDKFHSTSILEYTTITVWEEDKQDWRAFKTDNVISIKAA